MFELEPTLRLVAVGGGLLVALLLLVLLRRGSAASRRERPRSVVTLTPGHALHVVDVAGRRLLVGTGPSGPPSLLLELQDPAVPPWAGQLDVGGSAPPWVEEAARRGPEGWSAHGP